jgi:hypothetical protein
MGEDLIPSLVRANARNEGFWRFEKQEKATVRIRQMTISYTEGHDKIFDYYGRDLAASTKWFVGYTAVLLNPITGEIFMQGFGRFTFLLKYAPEPNPNQVFYSMDGKVDITAMGEKWSRFYGEEDPDLDALILKQVYARTKE